MANTTKITLLNGGFTNKNGGNGYYTNDDGTIETIDCMIDVYTLIGEMGSFVEIDLKSKSIKVA